MRVAKRPPAVDWDFAAMFLNAARLLGFATAAGEGEAGAGAGSEEGVGESGDEEWVDVVGS